MEIRDFRDALNYAITQEEIPYKDSERVGKAASVLSLGGLGAIVAMVLINGVVSLGPRATLDTFCEGTSALYLCGGSK